MFLITIWLLIILAIILYAILMFLSDDFAKKVITWKNELNGIETKITDKTMKAVKISAVLTILIGIGMLIAFFSTIQSHMLL